MWSYPLSTAGRVPGHARLDAFGMFRARPEMHTTEQRFHHRAALSLCAPGSLPGYATVGGGGGGLIVHQASRYTADIHD